MSALSNGSFVFTAGEGKRLHVLEKGPDKEPYTLYEDAVLAFACCEVNNVIALGLRSQSRSSKESCTIRIHEFNGSKLGDAVAEVTCFEVTQLLWVESRQLMACGPSGCSLFVWQKSLVPSFRDEAVGCFLQVGRVGLLYTELQTIKYWSFDTKKMIASVKLLRKNSQVSSVACTGYFCFALYNDGSVTAFYITRKAVKKIGVFDKLFPPVQDNSAQARVAPQILACALSSRKVLVGLRGGTRVHRLDYKSDKVLVDSVQEDLPALFTLMGFSLDGRYYLAAHRDEERYCSLSSSVVPPKEITSAARLSSGRRRSATGVSGEEKEVDASMEEDGLRLHGIDAALVAVGVAAIVCCLVIRRFSSR